MNLIYPIVFITLCYNLVAVVDGMQSFGNRANMKFTVKEKVSKFCQKFKDICKLKKKSDNKISPTMNLDEITDEENSPYLKRERVQEELIDVVGDNYRINKIVNRLMDSQRNKDAHQQLQQQKQPSKQKKRFEYNKSSIILNSSETPDKNAFKSNKKIIKHNIEFIIDDNQIGTMEKLTTTRSHSMNNEIKNDLILVATMLRNILLKEKELHKTRNSYQKQSSQGRRNYYGSAGVTGN